MPLLEHRPLEDRGSCETLRVCQCRGKLSSGGPYQVWQKNLIKYNDVSEYQLIFTDEELETEQKNKVIRQGGRFCE